MDLSPNLIDPIHLITIKKTLANEAIKVIPKKKIGGFFSFLSINNNEQLSVFFLIIFFLVILLFLVAKYNDKKTKRSKEETLQNFVYSMENIINTQKIDN
jgi:hypothetical protein